MTNKSQSFFDKVSRRSSKVPQELKGTALKTLEATQSHLASEKSVLDFGCGVGDLTNAIAEKVKTVHAIDTSSGMLEVARARAGQRGIENVKFEQSDLSDVDYPDGGFDVVTAFNVLHYLEDTRAASRRISELITPGGLFISSTACLGERRSLLGTLVLILTKLKVMPYMRFYAESELEDMISSGGFQIVETGKLSKLPDHFIVAQKKE